MNVQELHKQLTKLIEDGHGDAVVCYYDSWSNMELDYAAVNTSGAYIPLNYYDEVSGKILEFY